MGKRAQFLTYLLSGLATAAIVTPTQASAQAAPAAAASETEIVVTGSFIKRSEGFPMASPVDVMSAQDLAVRAPTNLSNLFADLPANVGGTFSTGRALGGGERGLGTVNLRGLGNSSTLVLLNGHRQVQVADASSNTIDVNSLVPDIMIERIEVLKDGASALYGSDAVAGVANVITRDRFSGLRLQAQNTDFTYTHKGDRNIQAMLGTDAGGKGHIVAAFGFFEQDLMPSTFDSPVLGNDRANLRYTVDHLNPGRYTIPTRNAAGALGASVTRVDPTCGLIAGTTPVIFPNYPGLPNGTARTNFSPPVAAPVATATTCSASFFDDNALQSSLTRYQGFTRGTYDITDNLKFTGELGYTSFKTGTTYSAGESLATNLIVPGTNPGAYIRATNNAGVPLLAQSSGISAGYTRDGAEVFLPVRNSAGVVQLYTGAAGQTPIPFYEDITIGLGNDRLLGSQCGLPTGGNLQPGVCALTRQSRSSNAVISSAAYLDGTIGDKWDFHTGVSYSKYNISTNGTPGVALTAEFNRAVDGLGGASCPITTSLQPTPARNNGVCSYFNPFGNSAFATPGTVQANTQALINYLFPLLQDQYESQLAVVDATISGSPFDLPAGPVGVAAGVQYRTAKLAIDYDINRNINNTTNLQSASDFSSQQKAKAAFAEFNVPIFKTGLGYLEGNAAVRYEEIGSQSTTNPKYGLLFNTNNNMLTLRGSYGSSFVAPSLFQLSASTGAGAAFNDCAVSFNPACTGAANQRITQLTVGNPNLKPSTADAYNYGVTIRPVEGLSISLDRWDYDFKDLIATESASAVVLRDPSGALGFVVRNSSGNVALVRTQFINAPSVKVAGFDFDTTYKREIGDLGNINLNLNATLRDKYDAQATAGGVVLHGLGQTSTGSRSPLIANNKLKANLRMGWSNGPASVTATLHYYSPLRIVEKMIDAVQPADVRSDAWTPLDIVLGYALDRGEDSALKNVTFTLGANNILDQTAPFLEYPSFQPFAGTVYDIRGRSVFVRLAADF